MLLVEQERRSHELSLLSLDCFKVAEFDLSTCFDLRSFTPQQLVSFCFIWIELHKRVAANVGDCVRCYQLKLEDPMSTHGRGLLWHRG